MHCLWMELDATHFTAWNTQNKLKSPLSVAKHHPKQIWVVNTYEIVQGKNDCLGSAREYKLPDAQEKK